MTQFSEQERQRNRQYAVIFDKDGVLTNTMPDQHKSWRIPAKKRGLIPPTPQQVVGLGGSTPDDFIKKHWLELKGFKQNNWSHGYIKSFAEEKEDNFKSLLAKRCRSKQGFPVMEGAIKMIELLLDAGFRVGVGSASPRASVDESLEQAKITQLLKFHKDKEYTATVSSSEVASDRSKPFGDIFKLCGENLGCKPKMCLVIEDAILGVVAATRAEMKCIAFRSWGHEECKYEGKYECQTENKVIPYAAFDIINHLSEITPERVREWFDGISKTERHV